MIARAPRAPALQAVLLAALLPACAGGSRDGDAAAQSTQRPLPTIQVAAPTDPEPPPEPRPYRCDGIEIRHERTFCAHTMPLSWADAERACVERGGHLATFVSLSENKAIASALGSPVGVGGTFWFGLTEPQPHRWVWVTTEAPTFGNWAPGEPNDAGGEDCAEWSSSTGLWNDLSCDKTLPYVCERLPPDKPGGKAPPMSCTGVQVIAGEKEYCFALNSQRTWLQAQKTCAGAGGRLAMPKTALENEDLWRAVAPRLGASTVWIGLTDAAKEGRWLSPRGEMVTMAAWAAGEPNNAGEEDCVELVVATGEWNDLACRERRPFVCERSPVSPAADL